MSTDTSPNEKQGVGRGLLPLVHTGIDSAGASSGVQKCAGRAVEGAGAEPKVQEAQEADKFILGLFL